MRLEARASGIGKALSEKDINYPTNSINSSKFYNKIIFTYINILIFIHSSTSNEYHKNFFIFLFFLIVFGDCRETQFYY